MHLFCAAFCLFGFMHFDTQFGFPLSVWPCYVGSACLLCPIWPACSHLWSAALRLPGCGLFSRLCLPWALGHVLRFWYVSVALLAWLCILPVCCLFCPLLNWGRCSSRDRRPSLARPAPPCVCPSLPRLTGLGRACPCIRGGCSWVQSSFSGPS